MCVGARGVIKRQYVGVNNVLAVADNVWHRQSLATYQRNRVCREENNGESGVWRKRISSVTCRN